MLILFNATTTTKLYSLSLHDALPIYSRIFLKRAPEKKSGDLVWFPVPPLAAVSPNKDRKSTRLNSSHLGISYAVFCLKKKKRFHHRLSFHTHRRLLPHHFQLSVTHEF